MSVRPVFFDSVGGGSAGQVGHQLTAVLAVY